VAARTLKKKGKQSLVTEDDISEVISELTNIPLTKISDTEGEILLNLENKIHEHMVNQEEAVRMVASSLRRARTELKASDRPIASFLFLGPTGVGKTQLAKTLSRVYFGRPEYMVRLDMSEYQHPDSVNKLIGDTGSGGYLTDRVRKSPFSLVLLDEIEKAHPDILNLFLQLLDEGRLTDGKGRTIDFTNTIIICTSNAGARYIEEAVRSNEETAVIKENLISQHLNEVMRPELINRFDGIVVFEPLSRENMVAITGLMLDDIAKMLDGKGIRFEPEEAAVRSLAEQGYDPKFGARPLRRLLQDKVEDEIARKILSGEIVRRDTVIIREDGSIEVEKASEL
jgi:ATP-dependent Clp protease ATP-binding subunit ClpC